jgi:ATP-binding cassette subfamily C protein
VTSSSGLPSFLERTVLSEIGFLAADAWRRFGFRVPALILMMIATHVLEGLAVATVLPLVASLGVPSSATPVTLFLGDLPSLLGLPAGIAGIGLLMIGLIVLSAAIFLGQARYAAWLQVSYAMQWQTTLFDAYLRAELSFLTERRAADAVNAIVTDVDRVRAAFHHACQVLAAAANLVVYLIIAVLISPTISVSVTMVGLLLFAATRPLIKRSYSYGADITRTSAEIQSDAVEFTTGAKLVKAQAAEVAAVNRLKGSANRLAHLYFYTNFDVQKAKTVFEFGGAAAIALLLIAGPLLLSVDIATVLVLLALFVRLLPRFTALQQGVHALGITLPALSNLRAQLAAARAAAEPDDTRPLPSDVTGSAPSIAFRHVTVVRGDRTVLDSIDLTIPAGRIVAFVGPSGSGKSTLVDAILGLVPIAAGSITINRTPLPELPLPAWRRAVGYVGQDTALMTGTVADNVRFGNDATDEQVEAALARASAAFVDKLALGSATEVGDRGARLSGGERQRIGLARALAVPRLLYILDEATSALDAETEAEVIGTVAQLAGKATVIVVAHRFSAIRTADMIHVVEDGRIVESGRWDELDRPGTRFRTLRDLQHAVPDMPAG